MSRLEAWIRAWLELRFPNDAPESDKDAICNRTLCVSDLVNLIEEWEIHRT